ncbi:MAG: hypothetical protein ACEQSK_12100 [Sphingomonadaceae bacterium]
MLWGSLQALPDQRGAQLTQAILMLQRDQGATSKNGGAWSGSVGLRNAPEALASCTQHLNVN